MRFRLRSEGFLMPEFTLIYMDWCLKNREGKTGMAMNDESVFPANFNPEVTFSFTALRDLAQAFFKVVEERERHYVAEYAVCSTGPLSYKDLVATLSKVSGKSIRIVGKDFYEAVDFILTTVSGDPKQSHQVTRDGAQRMKLYYDFYGIKGNINVLEWLIGRRPTTVEELFRERVSLVLSRRG